MVAAKLPGSASKRVDRAIFSNKLKECKTKHTLDKVCDDISRSKLAGDISLGNIQLQMYGSVGCVEAAKSAFDRIRTPNSFSWNHLLNAYTQNGHLEEAKLLFNKVPNPNASTWNSLMSAFSRQGDMLQAKSLFDRNPDKDTVSWNAMIAAYARGGHSVEAQELFHVMMLEGFRPNKFTFLGAITASSSLAHAQSIELALCDAGLSSNIVTSTALVETYARFLSICDARRVFDRAQQRDKIIWTTMLSAYSKNKCVDGSRGLFSKLPLHDLITATICLSALASMGYLAEAETIFERLPHQDGLCKTTMTVAYAQAGHLDKARTIFDSMLDPHVISWNVMITTYAQHGHGREALELFKLMDIHGEQPTMATVSTIFDACAALGLFPQGKLLHASFKGTDTGIESDVVVGTSLVAMYGRCGSLECARALFDSMPYRNLLSWTSMVAAYAQNGHGKSALELFHAMKLYGETPDDVIFKNVIYACGQAGLFAKVWEYFRSIQGDYGIKPGIQHYKIMIDLLGRAGKLQEAEDLIGSMPFQPDRIAWTSFLSACRVHGDKIKGLRAAALAMEIEKCSGGSYVLASYLEGTDEETVINILNFDGSKRS